MFETDFDYSVWTPGTKVTLANVEWDNTYRNTVWYESDADLIGDVGSTNSIDITAMSYVPPNTPIKLNLPFSVVNRFNYVIAENPVMPVPGKDSGNTFFYFITSVDYFAPNTTLVTLQLDIWQSYIRHVNVGRCYIERGHVGISAENSFEEYGRKFLTVPEGFDLGGDYVNGAVSTIGETGYAVIVASTIELDGNYGDVSNPRFTSSTGSTVEGLPNGCSIYYATEQGYAYLRNDLRNKPWIAQGIISVTAIPNDAVNPDGLESTSMNEVYKLKRNGIKIHDKDTLMENFRAMIGVSVGVMSGGSFVKPGESLEIRDGRYSHLRKFYTYPYSAIEITSYTGTPIIVKPETVSGDDLTATRFTHAIPPSPRIAWSVDNVNAMMNSYGVDVGAESADYFDVTTGFMNLPTFSLSTSGYLSYMASNAHSLAYSRQSADWSQQKALQANSNSRALAYNAQETTAKNALINRNLATDQTNLANSYALTSSLMSGAESVGFGAIAGGGIGAVGGLAHGALGVLNTSMANNQRTAQTAMSNSASKSITDNSLASARYATDTNYAFAKYATQGDYANTIAGINAKTQDAQLIPPSVIGQAGGEAFTFTVHGLKVYTKIKTIPVGAMRMIGEYWLRYGYALNVYHTPPADFRVMSLFSYWKMQDVSLKSSSCPETFRQAIRGILESGTTVWTNRADIGVLDPAENEPLGGIRL